ncbi:hypothetical protein, partial [Paenibacillus amylolyticus]|uniref:hypothetical protein n=1 Tax=Paenibacillus amylolyticus TaxID=1451 RepID=UPI00201DD30C
FSCSSIRFAIVSFFLFSFFFFFVSRGLGDVYKRQDESRTEGEIKRPSCFADEQHDILKYAINDQQGLTSLHQYLSLIHI